jgi:hypothetical protein
MKIRELIKSYWNGNEPLWKAFWLWGGLYFFLQALILIIIVEIIGEITGKKTFIYLILLSLMQFYFIVYGAWSTVSVWNCSKNSSKGWRILARFIMIVSLFCMCLEQVLHEKKDEAAAKIIEKHKQEKIHSL